MGLSVRTSKQAVIFGQISSLLQEAIRAHEHHVVVLRSSIRKFLPVLFDGIVHASIPDFALETSIMTTWKTLSNL
jgi:hypothetical protein